MNDSFTFQQELSFQEFVRTNLYIFFTGKFLKRFVITMSSLPIIIEIFLYIISGVNPFDKQNFTFTFIIGYFYPVIFFSIVFCVFIFFYSFFVYKTKPSLFNNVRYDFTHWGLIRMEAGKEFSRPWREVSHFKETKSFFFLFTAGHDTHIIQKRMMSNVEEIDEFRNLMNSKRTKL